MKISLKRIMAYALVFVMVLGMLPTMAANHVHAATSLTTSVTGLTASWEYNSTNQNGSYVASKNTITGTATGGKLNTTTTVLTMTNDLGEEATLKFSWELSGYYDGVIIDSYPTLSGAISASSPTSGSYEGILANGAAITITFKSPKNATSTLAITNISLISTTAADPTITFKPGANGTYTVDGTAVTAETAMTVAAGTELALVAAPASGYQFYGWQKVDGTYLSQDASYTLTAAEDVTVTPVFLSNSVALFGVGTAKYDDLTEAGAAAAAGTTKTIILLNNGTVSGSHTIPAGTTLLIPYDDANTAYGLNPNCTSDTTIIPMGDTLVDWVTPSAYRTLNLAADANITVNGNIEVGGRHAAAGGKLGKYGGSPTDKLGYVNMLAGSHIDLNSGANLYCWGYIYGDGTITAKSGASIYENFQIMDFRGGSVTSNLATELFVFPLSQYYVQNVEVATRYEYGATEYIATSIFMSNTCNSATVKFIGEGAMFQPAEGSYFIKDYNPATDRLEMHAYGDSALASMNLELGTTAVNSADFVLPITNNIEIHLHSGTTTLKQNMMMLPGSSLTIDQGATLNLAYTDVTGEVVTVGGYVLQIFDADNWTQGLNMDSLENVTGRTYVHPSKQFAPIEYSCTTRKTRTIADLTDVTIDINGTVVADGFMYSTVTWKDVMNEDFTVVGGGANVISSGKTGVVAMNNGAGQDQMGYLYDQEDAAYYYIPLASVQLKNGDGTLVDTTGAAAGTTYNYCTTHDCWYTGECAKCQSVSITWLGANNAELGTEDYDNGDVPSYKGSTPTKAASGCTTYTFAGWMNSTGTKYPVGTALPAATADETYTAYFTEGTSHTNVVTDAAVAAGCESTGLTEGSHCSACSTVIVAQTVVPATGHKDENKDHACDNGCDVPQGTHVAASGSHNCAYCSKPADKGCSDKTGDNDHSCDVCGKENITQCSGGTATCMAQAVCEECGQSYGDKNAANHTKKNTTVKNAVTETCGKAGYSGDTYCECGVKIADGEVIPATGKHSDNAKDGDHTCDVCSTPNVTTCSGGTAYCNALAVCTDCGQSYGEKNTANHASENFNYTNNNNGTHTKKHACCSAEVETVDHTYVDGKCVCEAVQTFTVTWVNEKGETVDSETVSYGGSATKNPTVPAKDGYNGEWNGTATNVTSDVTITPVYTIKSYMIHFDTNGDGEVDYSASFNHFAKLVIADPVLPEKDAQYTYSFDCWKDQNSNVVVSGETVVTGEMTVTMHYTATVNKYTITWIVNGVSTPEEYEYGATPSFNGSTDKAAVGCTTYTFAGWDKDLTTVTGDMTYTATYTEGKSHVGGTKVENKVDATCGAGGYTGDTYCANCGDLLQSGTATSATGAHNHVNGKCTVCGDTLVVTLNGGFNDWDGYSMTWTEGGNYTYTMHLDAGTYKFKIIDNGTWMGNDGTIVDTTTTTSSVGWEMTTTGGDCKLQASGGTYTFSYNIETNMLIVTAELDHVHVYGEPEFVWGDYNTCTATAYCENCPSNAYITSKTVSYTLVDGVVVATASITANGEEITETKNLDAGANVIYYTNPNQWSTVNAYFFTGSTAVGKNWPGDSMTKVSDGLWRIEIPENATYVIFNDNSAQTADLPLPADEANIYFDGDGAANAIWGYYVEKYTLTVYDLKGDVLTTMQVPYGAVVADYLKDLTCEPYEKNDPAFAIGVYTFNYWDITSDTMPAETLNVSPVAKFTGWYVMQQHWTYQINNEIQKTGWTEIDGSWYYLDTETGYRAEGIVRVPYPSEAINGVTYAPDQDTLDYCESKGIEFIDAEKAWFVFAEDGKFQNTLTDMGTYLDATRYVENGMIAWHPGMVEADGEYYYFLGDETIGGNILATGDIYVSRDNTDFGAVKSGLYTFGADGKLCKYDGITEMEDGTLRYYENARLMLGNGLTKVDENYIYVKSDGTLVVSDSYYVPANSLGIVQGIYEFDASGCLINPAPTDKNGFYYEDGSWFYYVNGVKGYCAGLISTDGIKWYATADAEGVENSGWVYVKSNGALVCGTTYYVTNVNDHATIVSGDKCVFGADCLMQVAKNGIVDGYYYENNKIVCNAGLIQIDGSYYYVRSNGQVVMGRTYWITNTNGLKAAGFYEFGADGKMVVSEKNGIVDGCYYVDGIKQIGTGLTKLEDGSYIYVRSNGELATGMYWITNHNDLLEEGEYDFSEDGILVIG